MNIKELHLKLNEAMGNAQGWQQKVKAQQAVILELQADNATLKAQLTALQSAEVPDDVVEKVALLNTTLQANLSGFDYVPLPAPAPTPTPTPVPNAPPTVTLLASVLAGSDPGTVRLTAMPADSDGTISRVDYYLGNVYRGTKTASPWVYTDTNVPAGQHTLTAWAYDNAGAFQTSAPVTVTIAPAPVPNVAPTVSLSANVLAGTAPGVASLSIVAADQDGQISRVELERDASRIATLTQATNGAYLFTDTGLPPGTYEYTAHAFDNATPAAVTASAVIRVTIGPIAPVPDPAPAPGPTLPMALTVQSLTDPGYVELTASPPTDGSTARVEFYKGGVLAAFWDKALAGYPLRGKVVFMDYSLAPGRYSYVSKSYAADRAISTSAPANVTIAERVGPLQYLPYIRPIITDPTDPEYNTAYASMPQPPAAPGASQVTPIPIDIIPI